MTNQLKEFVTDQIQVSLCTPTQTQLQVRHDAPPGFDEFIEMMEALKNWKVKLRNE